MNNMNNMNSDPQDPFASLNDIGPIDQAHLLPVTVPTEAVRQFLDGTSLQLFGGNERLMAVTARIGRNFTALAQFVPGAEDFGGVEGFDSEQSQAVHELSGTFPRRLGRRLMTVTVDMTPTL